MKCRLEGDTVTASFPVSETAASILTIKPESVTPEEARYGNLSLLRLAVITPLKGPEVVLAETANRFNITERIGAHAAHCYGGWGIRDGRLGLFTTLPSTMFKPGLLPHMVVSTAIRVHWFNRWLNKTSSSDEPRHSIH